MQTRAFMTALHALARAHGIDPAQLRVGSGRNRINPNTGEMEFDFYDPLENLDFGSFQFGEFDPGTFDPGNFNVNDLSGYATPSTDFSYSGGAPDIGDISGSFNQNVGRLATPNGSARTGPLSAAPVNGNPINGGTPSYTDAGGNPVEGVTVSANKGAPTTPYQFDQQVIPGITVTGQQPNIYPIMQNIRTGVLKGIANSLGSPGDLGDRKAPTSDDISKSLFATTPAYKPVTPFGQTVQDDISKGVSGLLDAGSWAIAHRLFPLP